MITDYEVITQYDSPNYTPFDAVARVFGIARNIEGVTYHWWGDPSLQPVFLAIINWLCRVGGSSSAHVVGEFGRIAWIVNALDAAWHAANARGNATTIGYECNPRLSDGDYEMMGRFHYDMEVAYDKRLSIYVHKDWFATQCSPIDKARVRRIADQYHSGVVVAPTATEAEVKQAYLDILERAADPAGLKTYTTNGMTNGQVRADLLASDEYKRLQERKALEAAEYAKNEWVRNLEDITDAKFAVIPAEGIRPVDLVTLQPKGSIIPKGTMIDIVYQTTVKGETYLISKYAKDNGQATGLLHTQLGIPAQPPVMEKPEWQKNLQDIADKDMWTRSETKVLKLSDGSVSRTLPMNSPVRITHATQVVGIDLLVLDGGTEAIEKLYLSDTKLKDPTADLEVRVSALEALVNKIADFLTKMFKDF